MRFDVVVVREFRGCVAKGMFTEIREALKRGIPVKVMRGGDYGDVVNVMVNNRNNWKTYYGRVMVRGEGLK